MQTRLDLVTFLGFRMRRSHCVRQLPWFLGGPTCRPERRWPVQRAAANPTVGIHRIQRSALAFLKMTFASWVTLAVLLSWDPCVCDAGGQTILEMLHIHRVSASRRVEPHPYMKQIYQKSHFLEAQDQTGNPHGTLIQSYRSVDGEAASFLVVSSFFSEVFNFVRLNLFHRRETKIGRSTLYSGVPQVRPAPLQGGFGST